MDMPRTRQAAASLVALLLSLFATTAVSAPAVVGYELASKTISGRTTVDYSYRIKVQNTTPALRNVNATVTSSSAATIILDGNVSVGDLPAGSVVTSVDTFTMRQDRLTPFDATALVWAVNGSIVVPNVVGLTQAAATTAITNAGLVVGTVTQQNSANVPAGSVINQNPAANASVAPGSSVSLVVSIGPANVTVPNVVGLSQAAATTAITNAGLVVGTVTQQNSANVPAGSVISQNPAANASVAPGSSVSLVVSIGPANVTVPNVVGLTQATATTAITNAGLVVGNVTTENNANVPAGNVISQNPPANASVAPGSAVDLVVSSGPVPNRAPIANAGPNQDVNVGDTVTLNGNGSSDPDNDPLAFTWSFVSVPSGSTATLSNADTPTPSFVADKAGTFAVRLIVNDGKADSAPDEVLIAAAQSNEIGRPISFTPPPLPDGATIAAALPTNASGNPVLVEIPGEASIVLVPGPPRPVRAVVSCSRWITTCYSPNEGRTLDDCARSAPVCATQEPWKEVAPCCPQACYQQYSAKRLSGDAPKKALMEVYASGACFPSVIP
jgi:beta-lactam-binding protein with PASTA domain